MRRYRHLTGAPIGAIGPKGLMMTPSLVPLTSLLMSLWIPSLMMLQLNVDVPIQEKTSPLSLPMLLKRSQSVEEDVQAKPSLLGQHRVVHRRQSVEGDVHDRMCPPPALHPSNLVSYLDMHVRVLSGETVESVVINHQVKQVD